MNRKLRFMETFLVLMFEDVSGKYTRKLVRLRQFVLSLKEAARLVGFADKTLINHGLPKPIMKIGRFSQFTYSSMLEWFCQEWPELGCDLPQEQIQLHEIRADRQPEFVDVNWADVPLACTIKVAVIRRACMWRGRLTRHQMKSFRRSDCNEPITMKEAAELTQKSIKSLYNAPNKPECAVKIGGQKEYLYEYAVMREWLLQNWPDVAYRLPPDYKAARKILDGARCES